MDRINRIRCHRKRGYELSIKSHGTENASIWTGAWGYVESHYNNYALWLQKFETHNSKLEIEREENSKRKGQLPVVVVSLLTGFIDSGDWEALIDTLLCPHYSKALIPENIAVSLVHDGLLKVNDEVLLNRILQIFLDGLETGRIDANPFLREDFLRQRSNLPVALAVPTTGSSFWDIFEACRCYSLQRRIGLLQLLLALFTSDRNASTLKELLDEGCANRFHGIKLACRSLCQSFSLSAESEEKELIGQIIYRICISCLLYFTDDSSLYFGVLNKLYEELVSLSMEDDDLMEFLCLLQPPLRIDLIFMIVERKYHICQSKNTNGSKTISDRITIIFSILEDIKVETGRKEARKIDPILFRLIKLLIASWTGTLKICDGSSLVGLTDIRPGSLIPSPILTDLKLSIDTLSDTFGATSKEIFNILESIKIYFHE